MATRRVVVQGRAKRGLFHGKHIQFGHQICFSAKKGKRSWSPNVQHKRIWSDTLQLRVRLPVTTKALRCIDRAGGLDNYLLKTKPHLLGEGIGLQLRQVLIDHKAQEKAQEKRNKITHRMISPRLLAELRSLQMVTDMDVDESSEGEGLEVLNMDGEVVGKSSAAPKQQQVQ